MAMFGADMYRQGLQVWKALSWIAKVAFEAVIASVLDQLVPGVERFEAVDAAVGLRGF